MCTVPRQHCAKPLLQARTCVGQKCVTANMMNQFKDLTANPACVSALLRAERPFIGRATPLCTTGLSGRPRHRSFAILYRLCQVPAGVPRRYHAAMPNTPE